MADILTSGHAALNVERAGQPYQPSNGTEGEFFFDAWRRGQKCIVPAEAIFEPDWRSGKAVPTRVSRADGLPMGIAGLWDRYRDAAGAWQVSYTMLTINAAGDPVFGVLHKPDDEKRSVVILPEGAYGDWLTAPPADTRDFLRLYPADQLIAEAQEK